MNQLKQKVEGFEIQPSPRVWEGIVSANPTPLPKQGFKKLFWAGAAATVVITAILLLVFLPHRPETVPSQRTPEPKVITGQQNLSGHNRITTDPSPVPAATAPFTLEDGQPHAGTETGSDGSAHKSESSITSRKEKIPVSEKTVSHPSNVSASVNTQKQPSEISADTQPEILPQNKQQTPISLSENPDSTNTTTQKPDSYTLEVYIPNAFVPDHDGRNDIFRPVIQNNAEVKEYRMQIYNRQGHLLFESLSIDIGWDGTHLGTIVDDPVCVYVVSFRDIKGVPYLKKGTVTVIR